MNALLYNEVCCPAVFVFQSEHRIYPTYVRRKSLKRKQFSESVDSKQQVVQNANARQYRIAGIVNCTKQEPKRKSTNVEKEKAPGFLRGLF
jgi:hypothetical protein